MIQKELSLSTHTEVLEKEIPAAFPKRVYAVYFSATGNTKRMTEMLAGRIAEVLGVPVCNVDFTLPAARIAPDQAGSDAGETCRNYLFQQQDLVVFGMPVYAGKIPNKLLPFVKGGFTGNGAAAIAIVTYGNRGFDHALAELAVCLERGGFRLFGAGAWPMPHAFLYDEKAPAFRRLYDEFLRQKGIFAEITPSEIVEVITPSEIVEVITPSETVEVITPSETVEEITPAEAVEGITLGRNLPAGQDISDLNAFAEAFLKKCKVDPAVPGASRPKIPGDPDGPYYVPEGLDGQPVYFLKAKPKTDDERCTGCGICEDVCPMGSIRVQAAGSTCTGICIKCHACIKNCPSGALYFDDTGYYSHRAKLARDCSGRKAPQWFL